MPITTMAPPDYDASVALLRECVAERGADYVYHNPIKAADPIYDGPSCLYLHDTKPGCIIGLMLYKYGVTIEDLSWLSGGSVVQVWFSLFGVDLEQQGKLAILLREAQLNQDGYETWGFSVDNAIERAEAFDESV